MLLKIFEDNLIQKNFDILKNKCTNPTQIDYKLIKTATVKDKLHCVAYCIKLGTCTMIIIEKINLICKFYIGNKNSYLLIDSNEYDTYIYLDYKLKNGTLNDYLTNHWTFDNNLNDVVSGANLYGPSSYSFTSDRYNNKNSAIKFNPGYLNIPNGIYFYGDFTISIWVKPILMISSDEIIDCGCGSYSNNVILHFSYEKTQKPSIELYQNDSFVRYGSNINLETYKWYHLVATLHGTNVTLYLNGNIVAFSTQSVTLRAVNRTKCYVGKSNWDYRSQSIYAELDDLKFFNKGLDYSEVQELYHYYI